MKRWLTNVKILWSMIGILSTAIIYFISLIRSYEPEINRLRAENMEQDSIIIRLNGYKNKHVDEINNIYDIFYDYNRRIKTLEGQ